MMNALLPSADFQAATNWINTLPWITLPAALSLPHRHTNPRDYVRPACERQQQQAFTLLQARATKSNYISFGLHRSNETPSSRGNINVTFDS